MKDGTRKRKRKLQITEYLSKRKKINFIQKVRKQMKEDVKNAPEYQKQFEKFSNSQEIYDNKENGNEKKVKRKKV